MWMKVDDRLHAHRKTRQVLKSDPDKTRDIAPMGLWVTAGSWAGQNDTDGWVPTDELDRWDDNWEHLADRLVHAGYWWPEQRDGEDGFGFVDWEDYNPSRGASGSGGFGNHVRWHEKRGLVDPGCDHCPKEPDSDGPSPDDRGDIGGRSGPDIGGDSEIIALPDPTRPDPTPLFRASADAADAPEDHFEEFWDAYDKKVGRKAAVQKYRLALRKPGVTADILIAAATAYVSAQKAKGDHPKYTKDPSKWLNGEHWNDPLPHQIARPRNPDSWMAGT